MSEINLTNKFIISHLDFQSVIEPLIPYLELGICTNYVYNNISRCKYSILEKITNFLFNQKSFYNCDFYCSSYSINLESRYSNSTQVNFQTSYKDECNEDDCPICLIKNNKNLILNIPSVFTMHEFLQLNNTNKYTFVPVSFCPPLTNDKKKSGHYTCLIINNEENSVYFFDPNGWTSYFNDNYSDTEIYLRYFEKLFKKYFDDLSKFSGIKYNYVSAYQWNLLNLHLNKRFIGSQIDNGGNCVALTILFFHYLFLTDFSPKIALEKLSKLCDEQKIQLINDYSIGLNRFIEPLLKEYKKKLYSKLYNETILKYSQKILTIEQKNQIHNDITKYIDKIFNYDEINESEDKDIKYDDNNKMYFDNYNQEKFELIYAENKKKNLEKGINTDFEIKKKLNVINDTLTNELDSIEKEYLKFFMS